ncbi:MAG: hypothetical protein IKH11_06775 [Bacteroidales bacterium]|nr:hypothetical protein [Bacteroidales bacterium]
MKKTALAVFSVIALAVFVFSCTKDRSINGTSWSIDRYEDYLDGQVMAEGSITGLLDANYVDGVLGFRIDSFDLGIKTTLFPDEYDVKKYTSDQLLVDLWYRESTDATLEGSTFVETFKEHDIYSSTNESGPCYVYFKSGKAIEVDKVTLDDGGYYYYDTCRIYCSFNPD